MARAGPRKVRAYSLGCGFCGRVRSTAGTSYQRVRRSRSDTQANRVVAAAPKRKLCGMTHACHEEER